MKKLILGFGLILFVLSTHAQLNQYAQYLIDYHSVDYEMTIKKYAVEEYRTDHPMLTVEINEQSESLFTIVEKFEYES